MKKTSLIILILILLSVNIIPSYTYAIANTEISDVLKIQSITNPLKIIIAKIIDIIETNLNIREVPAGKTIKILSIGNSFSQDSDYYLYEIAKSAGVNIVVGNLYSSGCSLERHLKYAISNEKGYTYYKWTSKGMVSYKNKTMQEAVTDEKWDYITLQQSSAESGMYNTYQPYLNELIKYIKTLSNNPDLKLGLNMTWAYSGNSTNKNFHFYNNDQLFMYNSIVKTYEQALNETEIDIILPCGAAIQNARKDKYLKNVGNELTSDGYHLNEGMGRYIAGLTIFQTIIVNYEHINVDLINDVNFIPDTKDSTADLAASAKRAAMEAVKEPFKQIKTSY